MKRLVIITVGKTHSGKTTFANALEQHLPNSLIIDQDNHAEFINAYYKTLLPNQGPNTFKYAITQTIVDYAVNQTDYHLILCNSNRSRNDRMNLLSYFHKKGFNSILVNFDIPTQILYERVTKSQRSTNILRSASTFAEVLDRQQSESQNDDIVAPINGEADHLYVIKSSDDVMPNIRKILNIVQSK